MSFAIKANKQSKPARIILLMISKQTLFSKYTITLQNTFSKKKSEFRWLFKVDRFYMSLQVRMLRQTFPAVFTFVILLTSMGRHVLFHGRAISESPPAHVTRVRLFLRMDTRVHDQRRFVAEQFRAIFTFKGFRLRVNCSHMVQLGARLSKRFSANFTLEWLVTRVYTFVRS